MQTIAISGVDDVDVMTYISSIATHYPEIDMTRFPALPRRHFVMVQRPDLYVAYLEGNRYWKIEGGKVTGFTTDYTVARGWCAPKA